MERSRRKPIIIWLAAVSCALFLLALLLYFLTASTTVALSGSGGGGAEDGDTSFAISGDVVEPVSPGMLESLDLGFTNHYGDPLVVTDVIVTVTSVNAENATAALPCSVDDFVVVQLDPSTEVRVEAGRTRTLSRFDIPRADWPSVGLINTIHNQDGCKSATLELRYTATGRLD